MNISIQPFTDDWIPQVEAFNRRMLAGGLTLDLGPYLGQLLEKRAHLAGGLSGSRKPGRARGVLLYP